MSRPYDGCAYRVSKVVGYIGSGTRTNHKRKNAMDEGTTTITKAAVDEIIAVAAAVTTAAALPPP